MTAALDGLEKAFANGYTPDDIDHVLGTIFDHTGVDLVCVWDFIDEHGCGGDSQLHVRDGDVVYELSGGLWPWLLDGRSEAPSGPGDPSTWRGSRTDIDPDACGREGERNLGLDVSEGGS